MGNKYYPPNASIVAASPGRFTQLPPPPVATVGLSTTSPSWRSDDGGRRHHSFDTPRNRAVPSSPVPSATKKTSFVKRVINHFNSSTNQLSMRSESRHDNRKDGFDSGTNGAFYDLTESEVDTLVMASSITTGTKSSGSAIVHVHKELPLPPRAPTAPPMFGTFGTVRSILADEDTPRNGMSLDLSLVSSTVSRPVLVPQLSDAPSLSDRALGKDDAPTSTSQLSIIPRPFATQLQETPKTGQTIVAMETLRVLDQTLRQSPQHLQQNQYRSQPVPYAEFPFNPSPGQNPPVYHANKRSSLHPPSSATNSPVSHSSIYSSNDIPKRKKLPPSQPSKLQQHQQSQQQQQQQHNQHQQQQEHQQRPSQTRGQSQQAPAFQEMESLNIMLESELISERQRSADLRNETAELQNQIDDLRDLLNEQNQRQESVNYGSGAAAGNLLQGSEVRQRWKTLGWRIRQFIHAVSSGGTGDTYDDGSANQSCGGGDEDDDDDDRGGGGGSGSGSGSGTSRWQQLSSEQAVFGRQQQQQRQHHQSINGQGANTNNTNEILRSITPHYRTLLAMKDGRQLLAQAAIWSVLVKDVFGTKEATSWMHWAGTLSGNFRVMVAEAYQRGNHHSKEFHRWRCHTASFLATLPSEADVRAHAELVVQTLEHTLWYTLTGGGGGGGGTGKPKTFRGKVGKIGNLNSMRSGLLEIVLSAIQFDKELYQQRAFWYCEYPASSGTTDRGSVTRFDPQQMEALHRDSKSVGQGAVVTLMVSPMLVKAGDSYGEGYDMPETIEKSVVHVVSKSKYWEDNGYSPPSPSPMSSMNRDMSMATAHETTSAMVVYRAPSSRLAARSRHVSRPATEKTKDGKKGKGKKWLGGLKKRTAFKVTRSDMYDE